MLRRPTTAAFEVIQSYLPPALVSRETFSRVLALARGLPTPLNLFALECRLGDASNQVDLMAGAVVHPQEAFPCVPNSVVSGLDQRSSLGLAEFCGRWSEPDSCLPRSVSMVWLAFDLVRSEGGLPPACITFCVDPHLFEGDVSGARVPLARQDYAAVADEGLGLLLGQPLSPGLRENLTTCFDGLPVGGRIVHLSAMLSRPTEVVKVNARVPAAKAETFARRAGWGGARDTLRSVIETFGHGVETIQLDFAMSDLMSPKLGVGFFDNEVTPASPGALDGLVRHGLCTPAKREALLAWSGASRERFAGHASSTAIRRDAFIKIRADPDLEAKGYLGFYPSFSVF